MSSLTTNNRGMTHLETLITKIAGVIAAGTYTAGTIVSTVDFTLGIVFKIFSIISLTLIIAVNWDNGTARIKKALKRKEKKNETKS